MSEFEMKKQYARSIVDMLPYLDEEQTRSYANAIAGAAMTNQMVAQMKKAEQPKLAASLMHIGVAQGTGAAV